MAENVASIEFDDHEWRELLARMGKNLQRGEQMLRASFMTYGFPDIIDHFEKQEGPQGRWQLRAPATQQWYANVNSGKWRPPKGVPRASMNPSNKLLQMTGRLRQSVIHAGAIKGAGKNAIKIFSNVAYSGKHQYGEGNIPARPFLWLSGRAMDNMARSITEFILGDKI